MWWTNTKNIEKPIAIIKEGRSKIGFKPKRYEAVIPPANEPATPKSTLKTIPPKTGLESLMCATKPATAPNSTHEVKFIEDEYRFFSS